MSANLSAATYVLITHTTSQSHAAAAYDILSNPDILIALALGGKCHTHCMEIALNDSTLKPHYAWIEAKRKSGNYKEFIMCASKSLDESTIMSKSEIKRATEELEKARKEIENIINEVDKMSIQKQYQKIKKVLRKKEQQLNIDHK